MATETTPTRRNLAMAPTYFTGNLVDNGLYTKSTTKKFHYGQRFMTWNGRIFKYAYATTGGVESYHGARSTLDAALAITVTPSDVALGANYIIATLVGRTEDDLLGGQVFIYSGAAIDNSFQRDIVGNDASGASTTKIYLDAPLDVAVTVAAADKYEIFENEYSSTAESNDSYSAWLGVPVITAAATYNYWLQTWGRCLLSGGEEIDSPAADSRTLVWGSNAALYKIATKTSGQIAGYIMNQGSTSIAGPTIYLMCST